MILPWVALAISGSTGCLPLEGANVRASDLASSLAAFRALPPEQVLSPAPLPGATRVFTAATLRSMLLRSQLPVPEMLEEICVERRAAALNPDSIVAAMKGSLGERNAHLEIVEFSRFPVPDGRLEFPLAGLSQHPVNGGLRWKGRVRDASGREYPVWADVRLSAACTRVVAVETLPARKPVLAEQLRVEFYQGIPFEPGEGRKPADFTGFVPARHIPAGAVLLPALLTPPVDIERGQAVTIEARSRGFRVKTDGVADASGRRGDLIAVKNPTSGKRLRARVESKTLVVVDLDSADRGSSGGTR